MDFCMRVARRAMLNEIVPKSNKNVLISPLSLTCLLSMVAPGTKGRTLDQLLKFLGSKSIEEVNAKSSQLMALARVEEKETPDNLVCGDRVSKRPSFRQVDRDLFYKADANAVDFESLGKVRKEIEKILPEGKTKGNRRSKRPLQLSFANGIWIDKRFPLRPSFQQLARDLYKAEAKTVDFQSQHEEVRKEVNQWAEKETKGLIKDLLPHGSVDRTTISILANALYFKGDWYKPFDASMTGPEAFHLLDGSQVKVPFMIGNTQREIYFFGFYDDFKILKLPYEGDRDQKFSMYFVLPNEGNGLAELIHKFNSDSELSPEHFKLQHERLSKLWIPKFKFSYCFKASNVMNKLGLNLPFEMTGDFSEMVDSPESDLVHLTAILQKSFIEVDEKGTEAAAVCFSAVTGSPGPRSVPPPLPSFIADHPFFFMIVEEVSKVVFFTGAVLNPIEN